MAVSTRITLAPAPPVGNKVRELVEARVQRQKTNARYEKWVEAKRRQAMVRIMEVMANQSGATEPLCLRRPCLRGLCRWTSGGDCDNDAVQPC